MNQQQIISYTCIIILIIIIIVMSIIYLTTRKNCDTFVQYDLKNSSCMPPVKINPSLPMKLYSPDKQKYLTTDSDGKPGLNDVPDLFIIYPNALKIYKYGTDTNMFLSATSIGFPSSARYPIFMEGGQGPPNYDLSIEYSNIGAISIKLKELNKYLSVDKSGDVIYDSKPYFWYPY